MRIAALCSMLLAVIVGLALGAIPAGAARDPKKNVRVSYKLCAAETKRMAEAMTWEPEFYGHVAAKLKDSRPVSWSACAGTAAVKYWVYPPKQKQCSGTTGGCHERPSQDPPYLRCAFRALTIYSVGLHVRKLWSRTIYTRNIGRWKPCREWPF